MYIITNRRLYMLSMTDGSRKRNFEEMETIIKPLSSNKIFRLTYQSNHNLLMSTIVSLNRSSGKFIITGLDLAEDGSFYPVISILDNKFRGVKFTSQEWAVFCTEMVNMKQYFEHGLKVSNNSARNQHKCNGFSYSYTTLYKNRTLVITQNDEVENTESNLANNTNVQKSPYTHKSITYLQATTFYKLMDITNIINIRLKNLKSLLPSVHECKTLVLDVLRENISAMEQLLGNGATKTNVGRIVLQDIMKKKTNDGENVLSETVCQKILAENYNDNISLIVAELINLFDEELIDAIINH